MNLTVRQRLTERQRWLAEHRARKRADAMAERLLSKEAMQGEICRRVRLGMSLTAICAEDRLMPSMDRVYQWRRNEPAFEDAYQQAMRDRGEALFEEALSIADDARNDWMARNDPENPGWIANGEHLARSRLRVETRKWAAAKLNPYKYGDKAVVEGNPDRPVIVAVEHVIVRAVQHETLPPLEGSSERAIDGWDEPDE